MNPRTKEGRETEREKKKKKKKKETEQDGRGRRERRWGGTWKLLKGRNA